MSLKPVLRQTALMKVVVVPIETRTKNALLLRLEKELAWSLSGGFAVVEELERFLALKALDEDFYAQRLAPSELVNQAWRLFMLDSRGYAAHCFELCSHFVHCDPSLPPAASKPYARTLALYSTHFGVVPYTVWQHMDPSEEEPQVIAARSRLVRGHEDEAPPAVGTKRKLPDTASPRNDAERASHSGDGTGVMRPVTVVPIPGPARERIVRRVAALRPGSAKSRPGNVESALTALERFLALKVAAGDADGGRVTPYPGWGAPGLLMEMWRAFVLDTPAYVAYSVAAGAPYIHFVVPEDAFDGAPASAPAAAAGAPGSQAEEAYARTLALYKEAFKAEAPRFSTGRIPRLELWPHGGGSECAGFSIRVKTLQGKMVQVDSLMLWHTVASLKTAIARLENIPESQQQLMNPLGGVHMADGDALGCYDLSAKSVVYLVKKK